MPGFLYGEKRILASIEWNQSMIPVSKLAILISRSASLQSARNRKGTPSPSFCGGMIVVEAAVQIGGWTSKAMAAPAEAKRETFFGDRNERYD